MVKNSELTGNCILAASRSNCAMSASTISRPSQSLIAHAQATALALSSTGIEVRLDHGTRA